MIGHRSERFCVFLPIFAGRDGEGNEQKLGEEWGQAKQWKFVLKKNLRSINTSLIPYYVRQKQEQNKKIAFSAKFCWIFSMKTDESEGQSNIEHLGMAGCINSKI